MAYFVLSPIGDELFNKFLSPDLDPYLSSQSHEHNTSCVKNQINWGDSFLVKHRNRHTDRHTDPNVLPSHSSSGARVIWCEYITYALPVLTIPVHPRRQDTTMSLSGLTRAKTGDVLPSS